MFINLCLLTKHNNKTGKADLNKLICKHLQLLIKTLTGIKPTIHLTIIESMIREIRTSLKMDGKRQNKQLKVELKLQLTSQKHTSLLLEIKVIGLHHKFKEILKEDF